MKANSQISSLKTQLRLPEYIMEIQHGNDPGMFSLSLTEVNSTNTWKQ